ncbi:MAG: hypothetical protein HKN09_08045 [Saprospiraceae bacterium]|nr:hypothetical protein [Saprospiraceae bacterium]
MKKPSHIVIIISIFYALLHIIQLEVFPFYHFGMYSEQREIPQSFNVYEIKLDNQVLNYKTLNYRRYVYITNTIKAYDALISSDNTNPSAKIISKYFGLLPLPSLEAYLMKPHRYTDPEAQMRRWLKSIFPGIEHFQVVRKNYIQGEGSTSIVKSHIVLQ